MSRGFVLLGACAAVLLVGGYWLGRSTSAPPSMSASTRTRTASLPAVAVAPSRAVAMPALAPPETDPTLVADLADSDPKVRRAALHEAVREASVDVPLLLTASRDPDLEVSGVATIELGKAYARGEVSVTELVARAQDRSLHEKVRSVALNGLGMVSSSEATALLVDLATRGSVSERAAAGILLRNQDLDRAVPVLIGMLADADAHVRDCARDSLKSRARGRDFGEDRAAWQAWWSSRSR